MLYRQYTVPIGQNELPCSNSATLTIKLLELYFQGSCPSIFQTVYSFLSLFGVVVYCCLYNGIQYNCLSGSSSLNDWIK